MKHFIAVLAVLFPMTAFAVDFSMTETNLGIEFGARFEVVQEEGQRVATGFSPGNRQSVRFWGEADEYSRAQAMVDLRPANAAMGRKFLVFVSRWMVDNERWGDAERFIDASLSRLKAGEKAALKLGGRSLELERSSDVQAVLRVSRGR